MKVRFNHSYKLRNDGNRALIVSRGDVLDGECVPYWISRVHPIYAMLLSLLSKPTEIVQAYKMCAEFVGIDIMQSQKMVDSFVNEKNYFTTTINGEISILPPHLLIQDDDETNYALILYKPEQFVYSTPVDLHSERLNIGPLGLVWMVTDRCVTDCVYCYAQKKRAKQWMSIDVIEKFLSEAQSIGIVDISLTGGEFFLHPEWKKIITLLNKYGYGPKMISTKMPMSEDMILTVKEIGNTIIQVSLDSLRSDILCKTLNVKDDYVNKIKDTLLSLERNNIPVQIGTVITRCTANVSALQEIYNFISERKNISRWTIRIGFPSLYSQTDFSEWKVDNESIDDIKKWHSSIITNNSLRIEFSNENNKKIFSTESGSQDFPGARCSANYTHCVILPDGDVTICEQLYWHPHFLIGNLRSQSIKEIWQGEKAHKLACFPQDEIHKESACHSCKIYEKCVKFPNKCYTDVLKAYGMDRWDYPDIRCKYAPPFQKEVFD